MRTSFKVAHERKEALKAEKAKARAFRAGEAVKALEKAGREQAAAKEKEERATVWRDLKLPMVQSYALCDEPHEVAECKAFADAMYQRITAKRYRSHLEAAEEKTAKTAANSGVDGVGK